MEERKGFGSNFGFLMAAVGSAVGLGNIWGFPNKMGANGGFTFLVIYLILAALCGFIVMVGELALGRKTANLILGDVYGQAGYVCDTHCIRITGLLGLTDGSKDPLKVEQQLRACIPPEESSNFCHRMVLHGRAVCVARRPDCAGCTLRDLCDYGKTVREP